MCMNAASGAVTIATLPATIAELRATPTLLAQALARFSDAASRTRPASGQFSPLETAWHLRDIEVEGYCVRIRCMLTEKNPLLADLDGDRLARERGYNDLQLLPALADFATAREQSLALLQTATAEDLCRSGEYPDESLSLATLISRMLAHDREHLNDLWRPAHG